VHHDAGDQGVERSTTSPIREVERSTTSPISEPPIASSFEPSAPLPVVFDRLAAFVAERNPRLAAALEGGGLLEREEGALKLRAANGFKHRRLSGRTAELGEICSAFFGRPTRVEVTAAGETQEEPSAAAPVTGSEQLRELRQKALNHTAIGDALEVLDGEIAEIRPFQPGGGPR